MSEDTDSVVPVVLDPNKEFAMEKALELLRDHLIQQYELVSKAEELYAYLIR